ncbi:MAG: tripartite tricarboxylate transporter substrate binding protein [Burkholderiales bacterium]
MEAIRWIALPLTLLLSASALAQYPERPIRLIVSYPPGGGTDVTARAIAPRLSELLGRQVLIDNRPGAGSTIGTDLVAKAAPDGYTLHMTDTTFGIIPGLYAKLPFDALRDFQPVTQVTSVPVGMVVHPSLPARSAKELVALARAKPGALNFGSGGVGTPVHMAGELLKLAAKIDIVHIPYKGAGPAFSDLIGGHFHLMFPTLQSAVPHIKSGRLRLIGLTTEKRSSAFPDTPTLGEAGYPGVLATAWFGIQAPKATPQSVVARLHAETIKVLREPTVRQRFETEGADVIGSSPDQFSAFIAIEIAKWTKVVADAGIKAE